MCGSNLAKRPFFIAIVIWIFGMLQPAGEKENDFFRPRSCWRIERDKINLFGVILFMRWLLFLSRLAFLCNCFFLLAVSLQFGRWFQNQDAEATTIIIGYFMSVLLNPAAILCYLILFFRNRQPLLAIPRWLMLANGLFLLLQIFYIFHLNAQ